ncbi:MAG: hypothetical protein K2K96_05795 [Lachnospiraceae bacterium]|nr:hypothetical protein [Lachnospiraceae bacterium]
MRRKLITLLLISSFSLYCTFCGEKASLNPDQQENDACRKFSEENLPMNEENTIEIWLVGVAQQVLALAVWCGIKQTIKIILLKKYNFPD